MRCLLLPLITFFLCAHTLQAQTKLPPTDKAAHFAVSAIGVASTQKMAEMLSGDGQIGAGTRILSSLLWLAVGAWKEDEDRRKHGSEFDLGDMGANALGVVYGNFLTIDF